MFNPVYFVTIALALSLTQVGHALPQIASDGGSSIMSPASPSSVDPPSSSMSMAFTTPASMASPSSVDPPSSSMSMASTTPASMAAPTGSPSVFSSSSRPPASPSSLPLTISSPSSRLPTISSPSSLPLTISSPSSRPPTISSPSSLPLTISSPSSRPPSTPSPSSLASGRTPTPSQPGPSVPTPRPLRATFDTTFDNKNGSLNSVACSNGAHGLVALFPKFGDIPSFPFIGGAFDVVWNSPNCGSCWNITNPATRVSIPMTAIDTAGAGFNIALAAFVKLNGGIIGQGVLDVVATKVPSFVCGL